MRPIHLDVPTLASTAPLLATLAVAAACSAACASSGAIPRPFPTPSGAPVAVAPSRPAPDPAVDPSEPLSNPRAGSDGYALAGTALSFRGVPYRNGGVDPNGFDCSGFTQYVFSRYGLSLPREVREQFRVGKSVKAEDLEPGDILFFTTTEPGPSHVAIAVGGDQFVHAPSSTGVVRVEHLSSTYWSPRYLGARRVTPP